MTAAIITGIFGLLAVAVSSYLASGIGQRRRLRMLREEAELIKSLPEGVVPQQTLNMLIPAFLVSLERYAISRSPEHLTRRQAKRREFIEFAGMFVGLTAVAVSMVSSQIASGYWIWVVRVSAFIAACIGGWLFGRYTTGFLGISRRPRAESGS